MKMKKKKQLSITAIILIIVGAFVLFVGVTYLIAKSAENKYLQKITYETYQSYYGENESVVVYYGDNKKTEKILKEIGKEHNIIINYISSSSLTDEQKKEFEAKESLVFVGNNKTEVYSEELTKSSILDALSSEGFIVRELQTITITEYLTHLEDEEFIVFLGSKNCGYCTQFTPVVQEVIEDYNLAIYYIDLASANQEEINKLYESNSWYSDTQWGTPTTLIFKNGEITGYLSGYSEKTELVDFLEYYEVI